MAEHGAAGDQNVCTGADDEGGRIGVDAAVDANLKAQPLGGAHLGQVGDLGQHLGDEGLPSKAGVDGHDQDALQVGQHPFDGTDRSRRVERDARFGPGIFDLVQQPMQVIRRFGMDRDDIAAEFGKLHDELLRVLDHQMCVERHIGNRAQRFDQRRAEGDIRHKMTVHNIDVDVVGAGFSEIGRRLSEGPEICGQNGRCDFDCHG